MPDLVCVHDMLNTMEEKTQEFLQHILEMVSDTGYVHPSEIPNIDLYMDQVTTFMEEHLEESKRHDDDKILTKTMINNYAKSGVLPSPEKKKYTPEHMVTLILIYYMKNFMSIGDIQTVLSPVMDAYFGAPDKHNMKEVYNQVLSLCRTEFGPMKEDITHKFNASLATFKNAPEENKDLLHLFAFIALLSFDVYEKKRIIEALVDEYFVGEEEEKKKKK